ncbi:MAG: CoA transferase [Chloroflexi bacterium]|nr:CoA transferase [Chloroflexota bacterium]
MPLPLEDIKVLDLCRLAPGSFCTMILGDLGADVLRIEEPEGERRGRPLATNADEKRSLAFSPTRRNKRSIILNLKMDGARDIFYQLAKRADVVVEGFRPGVVRRLGVDYDTVSRVNPRIVYCSISGYGQKGPYRKTPGHDINYVAMSGALSLITDGEGRPVVPANLLADLAGGGMQAAIGILAALMARHKTGRGQMVDIAMTDGVIYLLANVVARYFSHGELPQPREGPLTGGLPHYNVYETRDGRYIALGALEPWFWENLCRALEREDLIPYQNNTDKYKEIFAFLTQVFRTKTRDEWFSLLGDKDTCVTPVYTLDEVFADPQIQQRRMVAEIHHPTWGKVQQVGIPIKLTETPGQIRSLAPYPGQHTEEVLAELGYRPEQIRELQAAKIVG